MDKSEIRKRREENEDEGGESHNGLPPNRENDEVEDEPEFTNPDSILSIRRSAIASGFFDFVLFNSNVEHLRFVLQTDDMNHYTLLLVLLSTSLVLQVIVGILIFIVGFSDLKRLTQQKKNVMEILNHISIGLVALIAVINVVITSFDDRQGEAIKWKAACSYPVIKND